MPANTLHALHRSLYTGNDAAFLVTPPMGTSATTIADEPLIPKGTLEAGFQNDTHNPGQQALAKIVEILDLMRPIPDDMPDEAEQENMPNSSREASVRAVAAFLDSLDTDAFSATPRDTSEAQSTEIVGATGQSVLDSFYRQF